MRNGAVAGYLAHRLAVAGFKGPCPFPATLARDIGRVCKGVPRLVNIVAHKCLLAAYGEGRAVVTRRHVRRAIADTEAFGEPRRGALAWRAAIALVGAVTIGAAAFGSYLLHSTG